MSGTIRYPVVKGMVWQPHCWIASLPVRTNHCPKHSPHTRVIVSGIFLELSESWKWDSNCRT